MSATRRATIAEAQPAESATDPPEAAAAPQVGAAKPQISSKAAQTMAAAEPLVTDLPRKPALRLLPLLRSSLPRQFVRVPTHAVGVHPEHRQHPRAKLKLPLRLRAVGGELEQYPITLVMRNISSTGVYFLCPKQLAVGTQVELEVVLISKPMGRGSVVMTTMAHICRAEAAAVPGWYGLAACFDDVQFDHDDDLPSRFLKP
jgi:PilZ domain